MVAVLMVGGAAPGQGADGTAENLAYNGDFELASAESPPPGWAMWGAQKYKIPANYTRDTTNPHGGQACFRIRHPANTAGYAVSSPEHALRTKEGVMYEVTFWARTDKPGTSMFGFSAYQKIKPFVDAPSPGFFSIDVGTNWQRYRFEIHEGWDFFAHRSRYLLLTFKATAQTKAEKALWLDDVVVTERKSTHQRIIDMDSLAYEPVNHRLKPGEAFAFTVDVGRKLRRATRKACGVSFHRVAGWTGYPCNRKGDYVLPPEAEKALRDLRLPMTRFYGVGDEPFPVEEAIDKIAYVCERARIPQEWTVIELERQSADVKLPPEVWTRAVKHSRSKGYRFCHWEVSNEPYSSMWGHGKAFVSPGDYAEHVIAVSKAVRAVQPRSRIGIGVNSGSAQWGNHVLRKTAGAYDFVAAHYYCSASMHKLRFEDIVLTENIKRINRILEVNALIKAYNPHRDVYQLDTEWGCHSGGPGGERADYVARNGNIWGTMHRAVRMIYYVREEILRGASAWEMFSTRRAPGFGMFYKDAMDKRSLFYWLYYHFNRHVGDTVLAIEGTAPYHSPPQQDHEFAAPLTPVVATLSKDGAELYLVIANGSWGRAIRCRTEIRNFAAGSARGVVLSHSDGDAHPLVERKEEVISSLKLRVAERQLTYTIPPHAVVFITVAHK